MAKLIGAFLELVDCMITFGVANRFAVIFVSSPYRILEHPIVQLVRPRHI